MEFSVEALAGLLNKKPGEITDALKDSDQDARDNWLKSTVSSHLEVGITDAVGKAKSKYQDEGFGRGKRETLTTAEKRIRDKYEVEGASLDELIESVAKKSRTVSEATPPEDVKNSQVYIDMETSYQNRIKDLSTTLETEKHSRTRDQVRSKVKQLIEPKLAEMKFALPGDSNIKSTWIDVIMNNLEAEDTMIQLNGDETPIVVDANGKGKLHESNMQPYTFDDHLQVVASRFMPISNTDGKEGTGNQSQGSGGSGQFDFSSIKTASGYVTHVRGLDISKDGDQIKAVEAYYKAGVNDGTIDSDS